MPHVKKQGLKARTLFGKIGRLLKVSFGASTVNVNIFYKTVFLPVMVYASKAWLHRIDHWAISKNIKETQRQVLNQHHWSVQNVAISGSVYYIDQPPDTFKSKS